MKCFHLRAALVLALTLLLNACASQDPVATNQSTAAVPGEKVSGEGVTPGAGPGGASANVKW